MTIVVTLLGYFLFAVGVWGSVHSLLYARGVMRDPDVAKQTTALLLLRLTIGAGLALGGWWLALGRLPRAWEILLFVVMVALYYKWNSLKFDLDYLWGKHWGLCHADAVAAGDSATMAALEAARRAHFARPTWRSPVTGKQSHIYPDIFVNDDSTAWAETVAVLAEDQLPQFEQDFAVISVATDAAREQDSAHLPVTMPGLISQWKDFHQRWRRVCIERWLTLTPYQQLQAFIEIQGHQARIDETYEHTKLEELSAR